MYGFKKGNWKRWGGLESENSVSSMREKKKTRFVANISCDVIILRLCVARCDLIPGVITSPERKANPSIVVRVV